MEVFFLMLMIFLGLVGAILSFLFLFKGDPLRKSHAAVTMFIFLFVAFNYSLVLYDKNIADVTTDIIIRNLCMRPMVFMLVCALIADVILWRWKR